MVFGQALDQPGRARLGITVDRLGRCADRFDGAGGGPRPFSGRREIEERTVPEFQSSRGSPIGCPRVGWGVSPGGLAFRILSVKNEENGDRPATRTGLRSPIEVKSSTRVIMRHASQMLTHCWRKLWRRGRTDSPEPIVTIPRTCPHAPRSFTGKYLSARAWTARCRQDIILASRSLHRDHARRHIASRRFHGDFARRSLYTFSFTTLESARRSVRPAAGLTRGV